MADLLSIGGSAASVALNPESPTGWVSLAQSVGKALGLFGGGDGYTYNTGFTISGTVTDGNFSGSKLAWDQKGNSWSMGPDVEPHIKTWWNQYLGSNFHASIPIDFKTGTDWGTPVESAFKALGAKLKMPNDTQSTDISAPAIPATSQPAGTVDSSGAGLLVGGGTGSGGSSSVAPAPAAPIASSSNGPAWIWVALAIGAYYVSKH